MKPFIKIYVFLLLSKTKFYSENESDLWFDTFWAGKSVFEVIVTLSPLVHSNKPKKKSEKPIIRSYRCPSFKVEKLNFSLYLEAPSTLLDNKIAKFRESILLEHLENFKIELRELFRGIAHIFESMYLDL